MKRNGTITDFFKPFAPPGDNRSPPPGRRPSPFPHRATDFSRRPRWPSVGRTKEQPAPPLRPVRDAPSPTPESSSPEPMANPSPSPAVAPNAPNAPNAAADSDAPTSSLASLSSFPQPSQTSTASSKRTIKDGMPAVRTSDSEEDSDSSLEDLEAILARKKRPAAPPEPRPAVKTKRVAHLPASNLRSHFKPATWGQKPRREFKSLIPPRQDYKRSLDALVAEANEDAEAEAKIAEMKKKVEELERAGKEADDDDGITQERIGAALNDAEGAQRMFEALERTEALGKKLVWHFFNDKRDTRSSQAKSFPDASLPDHGWQTMLTNPSMRERAFLTGLVRKRLFKGSLPDEMVLWMMDEVCCSSRTDLTHAYLQILNSSPSQLRRLLGRQTIKHLFRRLGAKEGAISFDAENSSPELEPTEQAAHDPKRPLPSALRWLVELLRISAPHLANDALEYALGIVIRLSFDDSLRDDGDLQALCQRTISSLIASTTTDPSTPTDSVLHRVSMSLLKAIPNRIISHRVLQQQLIQSLPHSTPLESSFQRRLALSFFFSNPKPLSIPLTASSLLQGILLYLTNAKKQPLFVFTSRTDYAAVTAAFVLLDTAIDAGFSDRAFVHTLRTISRHTRDPAAKAAREAAGKIEEEFNEDVDALAMCVRRIMGQIRGSGTESMRMTEAKGAMERLMHRLEASVRTKEKNVADMFAGFGASAGLMTRWIDGGNGDGGGEAAVVNGVKEEVKTEVKEEVKTEVKEEVKTEV